MTGHVENDRVQFWRCERCGATQTRSSPSMDPEHSRLVLERQSPHITKPRGVVADAAASTHTREDPDAA